MESRSSPGPFLRRQYLRWHHGVANVAYLLVMHAVLIGWLWAGSSLVPYAAYLALSIPVCLIHQRILSEWFHEATHWNLVPIRRWNDWVSDVLIGPFNGARVQTNRPGHFRHHATTEFFVPGDSDTAMAAASTRSELIRGILWDLSGTSALIFFLKKNKDETGPTSSIAGATLAWLLVLLAVHGALFMATIATGHSAIYPLYFVTLLTLYPVANRFRLYGQHAGFRDDGSIYLNRSPASRTFHAGLLEQLIINSPMIMYHYEHHAFPQLPYRALRAISKPSDDPNAYGASCLRIAALVLGGLR